MEQMGEQGGERDRLVEVLWGHWGHRGWNRGAFDVFVETLTLKDLQELQPYLWAGNEFGRYGQMASSLRPN